LDKFSHRIDIVKVASAKFSLERDGIGREEARALFEQLTDDKDFAKFAALAIIAMGDEV